MLMFKALLSATAICLLSAVAVHAQDRPIGSWRSHFPYNSAVSAATDGVTLYVATELSFFTYNTASGEIATYSKVDHMSDVQMSYIAHDIASGTTILAYSNSNIDLFTDNGFTNIPDLKLKSVTGSKLIYHIYTENGLAYLSTGFGVVVINLDKKEIKETYTFTQNNQVIRTKAFGTLGNYFYVVTEKGLYRANKNNPNLQAFSAWQQIGSNALNGMATVQNKLFVTSSDSMFVLNNDTLQYIYRAGGNFTNHIDSGSNALWICGAGMVRKMNPGNYQIVDSVEVGLPLQVVETADGTAWIADGYGGISKKDGQNKYAVVPPGPKIPATYDIYANNKEVWVAHGAYNDLYAPIGSRFGVSQFKNEEWKTYYGGNTPALQDSSNDIIAVTKNPVDGALWAGSLATGLFILQPDGSNKLYYHSPELESKLNEPNTVAVNSIAPDQYGNMWFTQHGSPHELGVRTSEGNWYHFSTPYGRTYPHAAAGLVIDDNNQKWFYAPGEASVIVYNDNYTIDNKADDSYGILSGKQAGIAGNRVYCLAKDKEGSIWVGTDDGISIINCPQGVISGDCIAEIPTVQYDQFAGYLFQGEQVNTIAVDGANRKWVGTNNGIWLISPSADKIIYRFTTDNSPLPSNSILKINVDPVTGDVYIGTPYGMVSYRSTATDGGKNACDAAVFPNPVPSGYRGTIAIRNLVENADVRITDISGQMVYRTKALGGQVAWNGMDYKGHHPQSGVYLIFITNKDGSKTQSCKMVIME